MPPAQNDRPAWDDEHASSDSHHTGVELEILRGRAKNKRRRIEVPVFLIGSAQDCDLVLADPTIPEVHTYLYVTPAGVTVRYLGEGPELTIDDISVKSGSVHDGGRLRMGGYEFQVHIAAGPQGGGKRTEHHRHVRSSAAAFEYHDAPGVELVRALLGDIREALRFESGIRLYVEEEIAGAKNPLRASA